MIIGHFSVIIIPCIDDYVGNISYLSTSNTVHLLSFFTPTQLNRTAFRERDFRDFCNHCFKALVDFISFRLSSNCAGCAYIGTSLHRGRTRPCSAANYFLQIIPELLTTEAIQKETYPTVGHIELITHFRNK